MAFGEYNDSKETSLIEIAQRYERKVHYLEEQLKIVRKENVELKESLNEIVDRHTYAKEK